MISRRQMLAAGAALAGPASFPPDISAKAAPLQLDPALPEGIRDVAALESLPGKKPLTAAEFLRGHRFTTSDRLGA